MERKQELGTKRKLRGLVVAQGHIVAVTIQDILEAMTNLGIEVESESSPETAINLVRDSKAKGIHFDFIFSATDSFGKNELTGIGMLEKIKEITPRSIRVLMSSVDITIPTSIVDFFIPNKGASIRTKIEAVLKSSGLISEN